MKPAISCEIASNENTWLKLGKIIQIKNTIDVTDPSMPKIQLSSFELLLRIKIPGTIINTSPTIPLNVVSGIFKLAVVMKSVISAFQ